jgi:ParB family chromosome partitioning protein
MKIENITTSAIHAGERLREVKDEAVQELVASIKQLGGLMQPITVRPAEKKGEYLLVAGAHRLAAYQRLGYVSIPAVVTTGDETKAKMREIAENLHRAELTVQERADQIAEWIKLSEAAQNAPDFAEGLDAPAETKKKAKVSGKAGPGNKGGRGKKGGINAAVKGGLKGVNRSEAQRAVKIAGLTPEARKVAKEAGLDDNQSVLLKVSKLAEDKQAAAMKAEAAKKAEALKKNAKVAGETPVEEHARKAKIWVGKCYDSVAERVAGKKLVKEDVEYLIEQLQSLAEKAGKSRADAVRKLQAQDMQNAGKAEAAAA